MCENLLCCRHMLSTIIQFNDIKTHGGELRGQGKQQWLPSFLHARLCSEGRSRELTVFTVASYLGRYTLLYTHVSNACAHTF